MASKETTRGVENIQRQTLSPFITLILYWNQLTYFLVISNTAIYPWDIIQYYILHNTIGITLQIKENWLKENTCYSYVNLKVYKII